MPVLKRSIMVQRPDRQQEDHIKDNICVAGIPMRNGCSVLKAMCRIDATVVTLAHSGGEERIVGKGGLRRASLLGWQATSDTGPSQSARSNAFVSSSSGSGAVRSWLAKWTWRWAIKEDRSESREQELSVSRPMGLFRTRASFRLRTVTLDHTGPDRADSAADAALLLEADCRDPMV